METVYQRTESDCGVAALAMLAEVSYEHSLEFLRANFRHTRVISSRKILAGVVHFGGTPLGTQCTRIGERELWQLEWSALLRCAMLADGKEYGHWAVWDADEQCIRDPYLRYPIRVDGILEFAW
jgi:ABC-type bacteriocin/lantibiotic exporter with double-glycine peptidase domain